MLYVTNVDTPDRPYCDLVSTKLGAEICALLEDKNLKITGMAQWFLIRAAWEQLIAEQKVRL
jgi:chemotaxis receptor (MCP) glutamine deamidase CheD